MKFLNNVKKDGAYFWLTDVQGNKYRTKQVRTWRKLQIAQETSGHYAIISARRDSTGFKYDKLLFKGKCIVAYYSDEFEPYRYYHIYNYKGKIVGKGKLAPRLPSKAKIAIKVKRHQRFAPNRRYHK